jgi:DNA-binding transcriptional MerR regulator
MDVDDATTTIQDDRQGVGVPSKKKKCHGNRKDQCFRKKCRARGMNPRQIERLLKKQKQMKNNNDQRPTTTTALVQQQMTTTHQNLNKRKRDISVQDIKSHSTIPKSASSISMSRQTVTKKMKKKNNNPITKPVTDENNSILNKNYRLALLILCHAMFIFFIHSRQPMYLKRSSFVLFQMLNKTLNYLFKKKPEQKFIHTRLDLLDRQYFFQTDLQLWQSYLEIGLAQHRWPVSSIYIVFYYLSYNNNHRF